MFFANASRLVGVALVFFVLAHHWSVANFGVFMFCYSVVAIVQIAVDYGFSLQLVKDISRDKSNVKKYLSSAIAVKHSVVILAVVISTLVFYFFKVKQDFVDLYFLLFSSVTIGSYSNFFSYPFQGLEDFKTASSIMVYNNIFFVIGLLSAFFILTNKSLVNVGLIFLFARIPGFIFSLSKLMHNLNCSKLSQVKFSQYKLYLVESFPYALTLFFATAYVQADTYFIKYYLGDYHVGIYQAGMNLLLATMFVGDVFNSVYLPRVSSTSFDLSSVKPMQKKAVTLMMVLGFALLAIFCVFPKIIVEILFGNKYMALVYLMPLLGLIGFIRYLGTCYGLLLTAFNDQAKRSKFLGCAFVFNLLLNYLLVPKYHLWGALAAAIITLFFLNYCYMGYVKHKLGSFCVSLDALFILMLSLLLIVNTLFLKNLLLSIIIISSFSVVCIVRLIRYAKGLRHVKTICS